MRKCSIELWLGFLLVIFLCYACVGKNSRIISSATSVLTETQNITGTSIPTKSNITTYPEIESSVAPSPESISPSVTLTTTDTQDASPQSEDSTYVSENTQEPYPPPVGGNPVSSNQPVPYPPPIGNTPGSGTGQNPYPPSLQSTPVTVIGQTPYPGPNVTSSMNNGQPSSTQAVAINPIQTPMPSITLTTTLTVEATSTSIVRTGLKASDPANVKLASGSYQLIEFFAYWCPVCKSLAPIMNGLEGKYQGRLMMIYLDIDNPANKPFKDALGYKYQPHIFLLDGDGKIVHQWVGFNTVEEFETVLTPLFP